MRKQKKLGLSLRGGAGRAAGYIGVFRALRESDIQVDYIVGSSMGAIMGSMFAANLSIEKMIECGDFFKLSRIITLESVKDLTLMGDHRYIDEARSVFGQKRLEDLPISMSIQATNLEKRECEVFNKGEISTLLMASCAFPFYLPPVEINGAHYIDGDITAGYAVKYLKDQGADVVMGLSAGKMVSEKNHMSLLSRFLDPIMIAAENYRKVDSIAYPLDIHIDNLGLEAGPFSYQMFPKLIDNAYNVTMAKMTEIKGKLEIKNQIFYTLNRTINNLQKKVN